MKTISVFALIFLMSSSFLFAQEVFEKDVIPTSDGDLEITFIGHGTLMFEYGDLVIHADPVAGYADYSKLPKADIVLITHQHGDHLNQEALDIVSTDETEIIVTQRIYEETDRGTAMKNWDSREVNGIPILAVPAYNLVHKRDNGSPFHPKGEGNGYVMTFSDQKVYVAGDTENFPEMKDIPHVNIAFLPMNLPYTMTPEMVAAAARVLQPDILYPYHFGNTDTDVLLDLLRDEEQIEVRIRKME